jgi:hypothetical protein
MTVCYVIQQENLRERIHMNLIFVSERAYFHLVEGACGLFILYCGMNKVKTVFIGPCLEIAYKENG